LRIFAGGSIETASSCLNEAPGTSLRPKKGLVVFIKRAYWWRKANGRRAWFTIYYTPGLGQAMNKPCEKPKLEESDLWV
jgi:hypothetical protein